MMLIILKMHLSSKKRRDLDLVNLNKLLLLHYLLENKSILGS